jgi:hypothetical protein
VLYSQGPYHQLSKFYVANMWTFVCNSEKMAKACEFYS